MSKLISSVTIDIANKKKRVSVNIVFSQLVMFDKKIEFNSFIQSTV